MAFRFVPAAESIVRAAIESPASNILFYLADPRYELIDFACRHNAGNVLAFLATTSPKDTVDIAEIAAFGRSGWESRLDAVLLAPCPVGWIENKSSQADHALLLDLSCQDPEEYAQAARDVSASSSCHRRASSKRLMCGCSGSIRNSILFSTVHQRQASLFITGRFE